MEDIGKMEFAADHLKDARDVVHFIKNHHATSALFSKLSDVKLLAPSTTRFGFNLMMVQRLLRCEGALRTLVTSVEWRDWRNAQKKPEVKAHAS
jgi:hydrogenase maturation factor HypE